MTDLSACREQFPALGRTIAGSTVAYFDGPGGTQVPQRVIDAVRHYYESSNANSHGFFPSSIETDAVIDGARESMAALLGAPGPGTISVGANMTTLAFALARAIGRTIAPGDEIVVTDLDHDANVTPWRGLAERGAVVCEVPILADATLDMEAFASVIGERTRIVAVGYASNAVGTVNDLATVRRLTREVGATMVVDAVHFVPHCPTDVRALEPDFLLCSAYKFFGPHVGLLYSAPGALDRLPTDRLRPQVASAPQRIETGTQNHAALAGVSAAVEFLASLGGADGTLRERIEASMQAIRSHEHRLVSRLFEGLQQIPGVEVWGPPVDGRLRAPTLGFTIAGVHPAEVARQLAAQAINVWSGDFYAVTVVERLGLAQSGGLIRAGMAPYVNDSDVDRLLDAVEDVAPAAA